MNDLIVEQLNDLHFDGTWEALIPLLNDLLDRAESWMADDYHTTGVLTILTAFLAVCEKFGCDPAEHPKLKTRFDDIAKRLLVWFEHRDAKGEAKAAVYWQKLALLTQQIADWNPPSTPNTIS